MKYINDSQLDKFDKSILTILATNGRLPVTELAARIGLSKTPCLNRMKRLEKEGYIKGYAALINHEKLGYSHIAFIEVKLSTTTEKALSEFNAAVAKVPEIEQCHMTASSFDYLLKVRTSDITAYRRVLGEQISSLPHVSHTSTHVSMEAVKETVATR